MSGISGIGTSGLLAAPTFSHESNTYSEPPTIEIYHALGPGLTIYYSTNGVDPTASDTTYAGPIILGYPLFDTNGTFNFRAAVFNGASEQVSEIGSVTYSLSIPQCDAPSFTMDPSASYNMLQGSALGVVISGNSPIYYTIDGASPTNSDSLVSIDTIYLLKDASSSQSNTIRMISYREGYPPSSVTTGTFTIGMILDAPNFGDTWSISTDGVSSITATGTVTYTAGYMYDLSIRVVCAGGGYEATGIVTLDGTGSQPISALALTHSGTPAVDQGYDIYLLIVGTDPPFDSSETGPQSGSMTG